jgi:hypothetical protein
LGSKEGVRADVNLDDEFVDHVSGPGKLAVSVQKINKVGLS